MKRLAFGACCALALTAIVVSAQDKNTSMDKMDHMAAEKTYSGCLERSEAGAYALTHLTAGDAAMGMKKDHSMTKAEPMMAEPMMKDDAMAHDAMTPASLALAAPGKDLSKYVGHKVTVTGTDGDGMNKMAPFTVKSLKTIGKSCS